MEPTTFKPKLGRGFGRSTKLKINNYSVKAETLEKNSKRLFIDISGYVKFDCHDPKEFQNEYKMFNRRLKKKAYELSNKVFKGLKNELFIYTTTFASTCPEQLYRKYNYFCANIVLAFNEPIEIVEEDITIFASEFLGYVTGEYLCEPKGMNKKVIINK